MIYLYLIAAAAKLCRRYLRITLRFQRDDASRRGGTTVQEFPTVRSAIKAYRSTRFTSHKAYQNGYYYLCIEAVSKTLRASPYIQPRDDRQGDIEDEIARRKSESGILPRVPEASVERPEAAGTRAAAPDEAKAAGVGGKVLPDHTRPVTLADLGRR